MRTDTWSDRLSVFAAGLVLALGVAPPARAAAPDCPLRDAPFSIDAPLVDVMLSPAAKAAAERVVPGLIGRMPPFFASTTAPTFGAIVTLRDTARMRNIDPALLGPVDAALRALPVTPADRRARCARYDEDRPVLTLPPGRPRLLLFEKMTGFRDGPGVDAAHAAFVALAARRGAAIVSTDRGGAITPATLRRFDVVIWNNVSGDVLTLRQRAALKAYVEGGGGFVAVHGAGGDPATFWPWYTDTLIGARFTGHPMNPQFQQARVIVDDPAHPIARDLPPEWSMIDEWYSFAASPRQPGTTIVARLDESSYAPRGLGRASLAMGDHPIAWARCVGRGRSFYTAIGHRPESYVEPRFVTMLDNAVLWAAASRTGRCNDAGARPIRR